MQDLIKLLGDGRDMALEKSSAAGGGAAIDYSLVGDEHALLKALIGHRIDGLALASDHGEATAAAATLTPGDYLDVLQQAADTVEAQVEANPLVAPSAEDQALLDAAEVVAGVLETPPETAPEVLHTGAELLEHLHYGDWVPVLQAAILYIPAAGGAMIVDPTGLAG
jgi:hypothetical protein